MVAAALRISSDLGHLVMRLNRVKFSRPLAKVERAMNDIVDAVNENRLAPAPGYRIRGTGTGTTLDISIPKVEAGIAASIQQYRITAIFDDYLEARTWNGTSQGSAVKIAKPWRLRKTGWDGVTVTYDFNGTSVPLRYAYSSVRPGYRTATHTTLLTVENQAIIPVYSLNDILYATEPTGGTLVTVAAVALTWLDLNVDARAWARY